MHGGDARDLFDGVATEAALRPLPGPVDGFPLLMFSPDTALLAAFYRTSYVDSDLSASDDHLKVWRVSDGGQVYEEEFTGFAICEGRAWSPDGRMPALLDRIGPVRVIRVGETE